MTKTSTKGLFVTLEGGEGAGKTTLQRALAGKLRDAGWQVVETREPGGTELGKRLRRELLEGDRIDPLAELFLYAADRAQHVAALIHPALVEQKVVLCDRFSDSTTAYQGFGRQLDRALIEELNSVAQQGIRPDLTLWLDLPVKQGLARIGDRGAQDRLELEDLRFHERVRDGFRWLAQAEPDRIIRVDAMLPPSQLAAAAWVEIEARLTAMKGKE